MIARIWRGYTMPADAEAYETFLRKEFLPAIEMKNIEGYKKFQLLRRPGIDEVEFITIMWFENIEQIKRFSGTDYEKAVVHPKAQALLKRFDDRSAHFELSFELNYQAPR